MTDYETPLKVKSEDKPVDKSEDTEAVDKSEPTHYLVLADGRTVDSTGAIPTHWSEGDNVIPVVRAYER
jgi:hypothetical protein